MIDKDRVFQLFACCLPVRGACRSTLCDLERETFHMIPNDLYEILTECQGKTIAEIEALYDHECDAELEEYFEFLLARELGFLCDDPDRFPPLELDWREPERITHALVDSDARSAHDFGKIFCELDDLGCKHLELRFFERLELAALAGILAPTKLGRLRSIDLLLCHTGEITAPSLERLGVEHRRLSQIVVHSAPAEETARLPSGLLIAFRTRAIDSPSCCGEIHPAYFVTNIQCFTEAQAHNSCLNRKLSVDARGEIKNCPSMARSFGNVRDTSLHEALAHRDFRELWSINKDRIAVCRDCEFRYVCTDCRAYLTDASDRFSKPSKCTYDPYTARWSEPQGASAGAPP
jgi:SPASM domain peptide maturase of grasp-with-spasm system